MIFKKYVYEEFCSLNSKAITKNEDTEYYRFLMYINDAMLRNGFSGKGGVDSILKKQNKKYKNLTFCDVIAKGLFISCGNNKNFRMELHRFRD